MSDLKYSYFNSTYFSSAQTKIFIGNVYVDDLVHLEYNVQQNKRPLWGYASTYFDAVAPGTVIIMGSFSINYRLNHYLWYVAQEYNKRLEGNTATGTPTFDKQSMPAGFLQKALFMKNESQRTAGDENYNKWATGQTVNTSSSTPNQLKTQYGKYIQGLSTNDQAAFEASIGALYNTFWKEVGQQRGYDHNKLETCRADMLNPFQITIAFGGFNDNPFDVQNAPFTEIITDVHVTSTGKGVDTSGNPITEQYSFFAKKFLS